MTLSFAIGFISGGGLVAILILFFFAPQEIKSIMEMLEDELKWEKEQRRRGK